MKKLTTAMILIALCSSVLENNYVDASVFTRKNKVTMAALQEAFGETFVGKSYSSTESKALYDAFSKAKKTFDSFVKSNKLTKDSNAKVVKELLSKIKTALVDIYQSEKKSILTKKTQKANSYFNQNQEAYTNLRNQVGVAALSGFESAFRALPIPDESEIESAAGSGDEVVSQTALVLGIIATLQGIMNEGGYGAALGATTINSSGDNAWMFQQQQTSVYQAPVTQVPAVQAPVTTTQPTSRVKTSVRRVRTRVRR